LVYVRFYINMLNVSMCVLG